MEASMTDISFGFDSPSGIASVTVYKMECASLEEAMAFFLAMRQLVQQDKKPEPEQPATQPKRTTPKLSVLPGGKTDEDKKPEPEPVSANTDAHAEAEERKWREMTDKINAALASWSDAYSRIRREHALSDASRMWIEELAELESLGANSVQLNMGWVNLCTYLYEKLGVGASPAAAGKLLQATVRDMREQDKAAAAEAEIARIMAEKAKVALEAQKTATMPPPAPPAPVEPTTEEAPPSPSPTPAAGHDDAKLRAALASVTTSSIAAKTICAAIYEPGKPVDIQDACARILAYKDACPALASDRVPGLLPKILPTIFAQLNLR